MIGVVLGTVIVLACAIVALSLLVRATKSDPADPRPAGLRLGAAAATAIGIAAFGSLSSPFGPVGPSRINIGGTPVRIPRPWPLILGFLAWAAWLARRLSSS